MARAAVRTGRTVVGTVGDGGLLWRRMGAGNGGTRRREDKGR